MKIDPDESLPEGAEPMNARTRRKKRRRAKAKLTKGSAAVRAHRKKTGRTGQIREKHNPGKTKRYVHVHPNPPWQTRLDW